MGRNQQLQRMNQRILETFIHSRESLLHTSTTGSTPERNETRWYKGVMNVHPMLSLRCSNAITVQRQQILSVAYTRLRQDQLAQRLCSTIVSRYSYNPRPQLSTSRPSSLFHRHACILSISCSISSSSLSHKRLLSGQSSVAYRRQSLPMRVWSHWCDYGMASPAALVQSYLPTVTERNLTNSARRNSSTVSISLPQHTYVVDTCQQIYNSIIDFNNGVSLGHFAFQIQTSNLMYCVFLTICTSFVSNFSNHYVTMYGTCTRSTAHYFLIPIKVLSFRWYCVSGITVRVKVLLLIMY